MKIGIGMLLIILMLLAGCAPGYYASSQPEYQEEESPHLVKSPFTNPETPEEESNRIWQMESHP
jgi:hypothetical protein